MSKTIPSQPIVGAIAALAIIFLTSGCLKRGKGFPTASSSLEILTLQQLPPDAWRIDSEGRIHLNSRSIEVTGTCSFNDKYQISVNGTAEETLPTCSKEGRFTWTKVFDSDGENLWSIASSSDPSKQTAITLVVDTVPPLAPIITTNGGIDFTSNTASVEIQGTIEPDVVLVDPDTTGSMNLLQPQGEFLFTTILSWGQSKTYSFVAEDFAGNRSDADSISINFSTSTVLARTSLTGASAQSPIEGNAGTFLNHISVGLTTGTGISISSGSGQFKISTGFTQTEMAP